MSAARDRSSRAGLHWQATASFEREMRKAKTDARLTIFTKNPENNSRFARFNYCERSESLSRFRSLGRDRELVWNLSLGWIFTRRSFSSVKRRDVTKNKDTNLTFLWSYVFWRWKMSVERQMKICLKLSISQTPLKSGGCILEIRSITLATYVKSSATDISDYSSCIQLHYFLRFSFLEKQRNSTIIFLPQSRKWKVRTLTSLVMFLDVSRNRIYI